MGKGKARHMEVSESEAVGRGAQQLHPLHFFFFYDGPTAKVSGEAEISS